MDVLVRLEVYDKQRDEATTPGSETGMRAYQRGRRETDDTIGTLCGDSGVHRGVWTDPFASAWAPGCPSLAVRSPDTTGTYGGTRLRKNVGFGRKPRGFQPFESRICFFFSSPSCSHIFAPRGRGTCIYVEDARSKQAQELFWAARWRRPRFAYIIHFIHGIGIGDQGSACCHIFHLGLRTGAGLLSRRWVWDGIGAPEGGHVGVASDAEASWMAD